MGARVAPTKSLNFATRRGVKTWLSKKIWKGIDTTVKVVDDLRYLGAHITTTYDCMSGALDDRIDKAITQLQRLRYCPASVETKARIIATKVYAAALYGVEASQMTPAKIARLSAAVIDTFRSRNNSHNADRFYTTLTTTKNDLDPAAQILVRRVLQIRRASMKRDKAEARFKRSLKKYATKFKDVKGRWPSWYYPTDQEASGRTFEYPPEQPHPSTKEYSQHWDQDIAPVGPIGLLIEAALWHGMALDDQLILRQKAEQPIDILKVPYQSLKMLTLQAAAIARNRAEWNRNTGNHLVKECREVDRDACRVNPNLDKKAKGVIRTAQMGGNMDKCEISKFNQDVMKECPYCGEQECTTEHLRWTCAFFKEQRKELDKDIADIPIQWLPLNIRSGIAPAMRLNGKATFWGKTFDDTINDRTKKLLGMDLELHTPGRDADETKAREEALDIIEDPENKWLNARQVLLKIKRPHGSCEYLQYPTAQQIDTNMHGYDENYLVNIYGDGSLTNPKCWWAALGGCGAWMPNWNREGEHDPARDEKSSYGGGSRPNGIVHEDRTHGMVEYPSNSDKKQLRNG